MWICKEKQSLRCDFNLKTKPEKVWVAEKPCDKGLNWAFLGVMIPASKILNLLLFKGFLPIERVIDPGFRKRVWKNSEKFWNMPGPIPKAWYLPLFV